MREELDRARIHQALDKALSGLTEDPWLSRKVLAAAGKDGGKVKRKVSIGLVLAVVLALLATAALAVALLSHQEIMEQVAVPLATENDGETGVNNMYSPEELAELIRVMNENGITLEENNRLMQLIKNGDGYWEEETIMELCRQAFGGNFYTWTLEQQDWFDRLMVDIGYYETHRSRLPGPENLTYEKAEAFAFSALRTKYGADLPVEDRTVFALERVFDSDAGDELNGAAWYFTLQPRDLTHGTYYVSFEDRDPAGTVAVSADIPDWTQPYTGDRLLSQMRQAYGGIQGEWPQAAWRTFHEMLLNAAEGPLRRNSAELKAYRLTEYPDPAEGELSREAAVEAAKQAGLDPRAALDSAVLTEYEGSRAWLISFRVYAPVDDTADETAGLYVVSVDSRTGKIQSVREYGPDDNAAMLYTPQAAYDKAREGVLTVSGAVRLAAEAIEAEYPGLDLLNEAKYQALSDGNRFFNVRFVSKDIHCGNAAAVVELDGTVRNIEADTSELTGDTLMDRYWSAYGYFGQWPQARWQQLSRDMQALEPEQTEGKLIKQTVYPAENTVKITRDQAIALAIQATGKRSAEAHTCILIGAEPHPVWKLRMLTDDVVDPMLELDAETGEVLNVDRYKVDYTPRWHVFTLERDWRRTEFTPDDLEALARSEISFAYGDMALDEPAFDQERPDAWTFEQDGLTARFIARWAGLEDYEVTFDENGFAVSVTRRPAAAVESAPDPDEAPSEAPVPPPRADGKPGVWGMDFAPPEFWAKLDQAMAAHEVTLENFAEKSAAWHALYDADHSWPQDCYVIEYFLSAEYLFEFADSYPAFPSEGKKTREEILTLADAAFRGKAAPEMGEAWLRGVRGYATFWSDGYNYNAVSETYGCPVWWVQYEVETDDEWQMCGYVQLDEDGNVLDAQVEMSNG